MAFHGTGGVDNTITGDTPVSPTSSLPSWLGGGGSAAPGNLGSMLNPDGTYVLPPGPSVDPGSSVVAPGGGVLSPGSPGYDQAAASISATPQVTPAAGSGGGSLFGGISNGQLLGAGIAGTGLLYDITQKNNIPGESNISNLSNQLNNQSAQLQSYVTNGTLPPGVGQVLSQVQKSMTDQIKAKYAQLGMSGSTGEQQDIDNAALQVQSQGATEALNLMNQGVSLTQLSAQLMTTLLNSNTQQNQQTVSSISNLASALAGGGQTVRLQAAA